MIDPVVPVVFFHAFLMDNGSPRAAAGSIIAMRKKQTARTIAYTTRSMVETAIKPSPNAANTSPVGRNAITAITPISKIRRMYASTLSDRKTGRKPSGYSSNKTKRCQETAIHPMTGATTTKVKNPKIGETFSGLPEAKPDTIWSLKFPVAPNTSARPNKTSVPMIAGPTVI